MKFALTLLLLTILQKSANGAIAKTCAANPMIPLYDSLMTQQATFQAGKGKKKGGSKFDQLTVFKAATAAKATGLSYCKAFEGKTTCCVDKFVKQIPRLTMSFFREKMFIKPKIQKTLKGFAVKLKSCGGTKGEGVIGKGDVKAIVKDSRKCQKLALKAELNLMRANLCNICIDPANYDAVYTLVDDTKPTIATNLDTMTMKIKSLDTYDTDMAAAQKCSDDAQAKIKTLISTAVAALGDACKAEKATIETELAKKLAGGAKCKDSAKLSGKGCLDQQNGDELPAPKRRNLANVASNFVIDAANGVDGYLVDTTENAALDAEADPDADFAAPPPGTTTPTAGSASMLQYGALTLLSVLLIVL